MATKTNDLKLGEDLMNLVIMRRMLKLIDSNMDMIKRAVVLATLAMILSVVNLIWLIQL